MYVLCHLFNFEFNFLRFLYGKIKQNSTITTYKSNSTFKPESFILSRVSS